MPGRFPVRFRYVGGDEVEVMMAAVVVVVMMRSTSTQSHALWF